MATRIVNLLVGPESDGMRLDAFLATGPDMPSRSACARLVEEGSVTINLRGHVQEREGPPGRPRHLRA